MNDKVKAYNEGVLAGRASWPYSSNPYSEETPEHNEWLDGHRSTPPDRSRFTEPVKSKSRKWVELTNEEIDSIEWPANKTLSEYARAIEAKLKEKNSGY